MATHYLTEASVIACGKASAPDCSADADKVTCKNCLRSQAFAQRQQAAQPAASAAPEAPATAVAKPSLAVVLTNSGKSSALESRKAKSAVQKPAKGVAFAEWRQRFSANDRLPRGKAFASM